VIGKEILWFHCGLLAGDAVVAGPAAAEKGLRARLVDQRRAQDEQVAGQFHRPGEIRAIVIRIIRWTPCAIICCARRRSAAIWISPTRFPQGFQRIGKRRRQLPQPHDQNDRPLRGGNLPAAGGTGADRPDLIAKAPRCRQQLARPISNLDLQQCACCRWNWPAPPTATSTPPSRSNWPKTRQFSRTTGDRPGRRRQAIRQALIGILARPAAQAAGRQLAVVAGFQNWMPLNGVKIRYRRPIASFQEKFDRLWENCKPFG
jgi:hypothetical protein